MEISYFGHSCFKAIGKNITVIMDPFDSKEVGYNPIRSSADAVLVTHEHSDHNYIKAVSGEPVIFDSPGEYEIKDTSIDGILSQHGNDNKEIINTIFVFEIDDIKICHLGDLGVELSPEQLEKVDGVDILLVPVGGTYTLNAEEASKVIAQIEPKIVIPMHYATKEGKAGGGNLTGVDKFLHEMGVSDIKPIPRLKIQKKDLPEEMEIMVLEY